MTMPVSSPHAVRFAERPMLVFWETTRSVPVGVPALQGVRGAPFATRRAEQRRRA